MSKIKIAVVFLVLLLIVGIFSVYAGLSFIGGGSASYGSVHGQIKAAGFGNTLVTGKMTVTGSNLTAWCQNHGGNIAPGQNLVNVNMAEQDSTFTENNGNVTFDFSVDIRPTSEVAGCPNGNWTVVDVTGTIQILFEAWSADEYASQTLTCYLDEPGKTITC